MQSIVEDIKAVFRSGNILSRLIVINTIALVMIYLVKITLMMVYQGDAVAFDTFIQYLSVHSDVSKNIFRPWVFITHAFTHVGLLHFAFNMLMLYWFGRIVGDLINDRRLLTIFILGVAGGVLAFIIFGYFIPSMVGYAHGASAGVMAVIIASGLIAPDHVIHLILLGPVRLKYVVLVLLFLDLVSISNMSNTGGHIAHLGGAFMGLMFVRLLYSGYDLSEKLLWRKPDTHTYRKKHERAKVVVMSSHRNQRKSDEEMIPTVDMILDKIKKTGLESLSSQEKDILEKASKE